MRASNESKVVWVNDFPGKNFKKALLTLKRQSKPHGLTYERTVGKSTFPQRKQEWIEALENY